VLLSAQAGFWRFVANVAYSYSFIESRIDKNMAYVPAYILYVGDSTISFWRCQERERRDYADIDRKTIENEREEHHFLA
jgi:hypothetical protein